MQYERDRIKAIVNDNVLKEIKESIPGEWMNPYTRERAESVISVISLRVRAIDRICQMIIEERGAAQMGKKLRYSVLRYSPSITSGEAINLGILFSEEEGDFHTFWFTKNFQRITRFDDTLEKNVLKDLLTGIQLEVDDLVKDGCFDLDSFIKFYINDFHFEKPRTILYEVLDETVEVLKKSYFRFDYRKEDRPSKVDDQKLIASWIRASGRDTKKNASVRGKYADQVRYDFATEDYLVKIFDFDGKDLTRCINSAKAWAWNCDHEPKTVFVI